MAQWAIRNLNKKKLMLVMLSVFYNATILKVGNIMIRVCPTMHIASDMDKVAQK